jgi:t-SNARE complex subunit (syntaxin)
MKDYIESIQAGRNITDAQRSPKVIAERNARKQFWIVHVICFIVAIIAGDTFGMAGFVAVYAALIVFAIGHDTGASK